MGDEPALHPGGFPASLGEPARSFLGAEVKMPAAWCPSWGKGHCGDSRVALGEPSLRAERKLFLPSLGQVGRES